MGTAVMGIGGEDNTFSAWEARHSSATKEIKSAFAKKVFAAIKRNAAKGNQSIVVALPKPYRALTAEGNSRREALIALLGNEGYKYHYRGKDGNKFYGGEDYAILTPTERRGMAQPTHIFIDWENDNRR